MPRLVADGLRDRDVADALFLSRSTVNTHVARALNKLGVPSREAAIAVTVRCGLLRIGSCGENRYPSRRTP